MVRKEMKTGKLKSLHLFMENSHHPYAIRIYSGKTRVDQVQLPSGKKYHLCSMPYYLLSKLDAVREIGGSSRYCVTSQAQDVHQRMCLA